MNDTAVILRYLYLGTDQPFYIHKNRALDVKEGCRILAPIRTLVEATAATEEDPPVARKVANSVTLTEPPVDMIVRVMKSGSLVRNDECLFALAFLARTFTDKEEKHKVYEVVPQVIGCSEDLFQFVNFYKELAPDAGGKGLGNGMRTALTKWYDKHSALELAELLAIDRGFYGWCHKDILLMIHINLKDDAKMQVLDCALGGPGKRRKSKSKKPKQENGSEENDSGVQTTEKLPKVEEGDDSEEESEALQVYRRMKKFKSIQTSALACGPIKQYRYPKQLVPSQLHRSSAVWESLLPHMVYRDVVQSALVLQDYKLLKDNDTPLSIAYGNVLNRMTSVTESKLHPIFIYQTMRLFEERQRYLNVVKEAVHTTNNLALKNATANPAVLRQFNSALNHSMLNYQRTGLNFLVTLDLRSKQTKKRIFGNRLMSCQAAFILLTLPMFKREPHMKVLTFTEAPHVLADVDFTREMTFFQACDHIQAKANKKTKVDITQPIQYARQNKKKVDVFITIVDSLIRVNPNRHSPVVALNSYNKETKKNAVYIIISLSRHQQDLDHVDMASTKGVLELVGCTEDIPKLIDAYVKRSFT
ncbi:RNA-binding protein RO60-like [Wyeomyia smithii]|uniref:RNA-binding protein RO60-like n=1 Tax=Wyeomyia smithii TaxID=174621 RepID=UPI002468060D|nr:RNA-binding protein RO60-like [Wyeomyia smithii]XP_055549320.1 RNA-binding protein RO60-like [Wyeomyia smithii]